MHESFYITTRQLLTKQGPAGKGKDQTPHAVKGATAADQGTAPLDKGSRGTASATAAMESFDLNPTKSVSPSDLVAVKDIAWGPLGPIAKPKPITRKLSNPPHVLNPSAGGVAAANAANMERTYTRRPNSKESTTSSARTAASSSTGHSGISSGFSLTTSAASNSTRKILHSLPETASDQSMRRPFTLKYGRKYLSDPQSYYPLPFTISELHRQVLRSMLLVSVFGSPLCSPLWAAPNPPPKKILEVGCGNGYWSALCHKHFARLGHSVQFTGFDIAPVASDMRAEGMDWRFVQHDLRSVPIPFKNEEFDIIMVKDLALINSALNLTANLMEEYFRCLKPGGQMEVWDSDSTIRLLSPHSPSCPDTISLNSTDSESDDLDQADGTGTYVITPQTPFKDAQNPYISEYNEWMTAALSKRGITTMPCTLMGPLLAQEPQLGDVQTRRIAIPFSAMRWEREDESENGRLMNVSEGKRILTDSQKALRHTALLQFVMWIESMEPILREASEKSQDEWDRWYSDMMSDLLEKDGTAAGECLEIGAWWATKKGKPKVGKGNSAIAEARRRNNVEVDRDWERGGDGPLPVRGSHDKPSPYHAEAHLGQMWDMPGQGETLL